MEKLWKAGAVPLFELPDPPDYTLDRAPLAQALAQVRYPLVASLETMAGIAPLQERLRDHLPYMEQLRTQEISFLGGPGGPQAGSSESTSWNLTNDAGYALAVSAGVASLSVGSAYTSVADFGELFRGVLVALASAGIPRCDRLAVKYLSIAPDLVGQPRSWRKWFRSDLTGWSGTEVLNDDAAVSAISQVQVSAPPTGDLAGPPAEVQAVIRNGFIPPGTLVPAMPPLQVEEPSYLIDLDLSTLGNQPFDPDSLVKQFFLFHSEIDKFFYWTLTTEGGEHFGLEVGNS